jgi:hypothetical protein
VERRLAREREWTRKGGAMDDVAEVCVSKKGEKGGGKRKRGREKYYTS